MEKFTAQKLEEMASKLESKESYEDTTISVALLRALIEQARTEHGALRTISDMHCGDQPASSEHSEEIYLRLHIGKMRAAALAALK